MYILSISVPICVNFFLIFYSRFDAYPNIINIKIFVKASCNFFKEKEKSKKEKTKKKISTNRGLC
jgi:hypothetical protein